MSPIPTLSILAIALFQLAACKSHHRHPHGAMKALPSTLHDATPLRSTTVARTSHGEAVRVSATAVGYEEPRHGRVRLDGAVPETVLEELSVTVGNRDVSPPESEYSGFGDPNIGSEFFPLRIEEDSEGLLYLYLSGGDGAGSHRRRFVLSSSSWLRTDYRNPVTGTYPTPDKQM